MAEICLYKLSKKPTICRGLARSPPRVPTLTVSVKVSRSPPPTPPPTPSSLYRSKDNLWRQICLYRSKDNLWRQICLPPGPLSTCRRETPRFIRFAALRKRKSFKLSVEGGPERTTPRIGRLGTYGRVSGVPSLPILNPSLPNRVTGQGPGGSTCMHGTLRRCCLFWKPTCRRETPRFTRPTARTIVAVPEE